MYQPQPGTIAHRVVEFLKKQPDGAMLATAVIAEALDIPSNSFSAYLETAMNHGLVVSRKEGHLRLYGLGDGSTPAPGYASFTDHTPQDLAMGEPVQRVVPAAPEPTPAPASAKAKAKVKAAPKEKPIPCVMVSGAPELPADAIVPPGMKLEGVVFGVALPPGQVFIRAHGKTVWLEQNHARTLRALLEFAQ